MRAVDAPKVRDAKTIDDVQRVAALARPSEVLVSSTVKDLVDGSALALEDAGEYEMNGSPDRWCLRRATR
jgi:class 3 adenylate cyclase